jgi:hypothetical protein
VTPTKRRCTRRRLPALKMQLLLLMMPLQGQKMIIVMIRAPIRRLVATATAEVMPMSLRLPHQEGVEAVVL